MKTPKLIIFGLDAAVESLLLPWVQAGKLPHLASLMKDGCYGRLESVMPPLTPAAWTSFMTGKNPGKHGIFNFMEPSAEGYGMVYTNGGNRKTESLWKMLNQGGLTTGVINTPFTFPPEKVEGFMISGLDTPSSESSFIHPPKLKEEIEKQFGRLELDARYLGAMTNLKKRALALDGFRKVDEQWSKLSLYCLEKHPQDLMMFTFMSIDSAEHHFWHYMDPKHFYHDPEGADLFKDAILEVYQRLDATLGEILKRIDRSKTDVIVLSDHGQEAVSDRTLHINRILQQAGLLNYKKSSPIKRMVAATIGPIHGLLKKVLSHSQKAALASLFPKLRDNADGIVTSYNDIDWTRTKAYCHEAWATPPSVSINLRGVKPQGIVDESDYETVIGQVLEALYAVKDPRTGTQVIAHAYRRNELYSGPCTRLAPDLTLKWWGASPFNTKPSLAGETNRPVLTIEQPRPLRVPEWSGHHTLEGILIASGPSFKRETIIQGARLYDMAPTLLHLLNLPVPADMDGVILKNILNESITTEGSRPIVKSTSPEKEVVGDKYAYSDQETALVEERLKNLGYLE